MTLENTVTSEPMVATSAVLSVGLAFSRFCQFDAASKRIGILISISEIKNPPKGAFEYTILF